MLDFENPEIMSVICLLSSCIHLLHHKGRSVKLLSDIKPVRGTKNLGTAGLFNLDLKPDMI